MTPQQLAAFQQQYPGIDPSSTQGQALVQQFLSANGGQQQTNAGTNAGTNPTGLDLGSLVGSPNQVGISNALNNATSDALKGGNTQQVQGAQQVGAFQSTGDTTSQGTQQETGIQQGTTTGQQQQAGVTQSQQQQATTGLTQQQQAQQTAQQQQTAEQQAQTQQQQTAQTGATTGTSAAAQTGATTGLTQVLDSLGLGQLLQQGAPQAAASTANSQNFLNGVVQGNNPLLQAQTANAVNQATSGPGMVGAGVGANARAAGDAAAQVGLSSQAQQINAANALGNPTATTTLAAAGNPYLGQTTSGTSAANTTGATTGTTAANTTAALQGLTNTTGATNTTGTANTSGTTATQGLSDTTGSTLSAQDLSTLSNSLNLSSLLNQSNTATQEQQSGTSAANSSQEAIGQVPQSQTSSGSGCYVCTAYADLGLIKHSDIRIAAEFKLSRERYQRSLAGYGVYGPTLSKWVLQFPLFQRLFLPVARGILEAELSLAGARHATLFDHCVHSTFHYGSIPIAYAFGRKKIYTKDKETIALLNRNNLNFEVQ